jgi:hypothetical protein
MRFKVWNVRGLYSSGLSKRGARELVKYRLGLVGKQVVRWDNRSIEREGKYAVFFTQREIKMIK